MENSFGPFLKERRLRAGPSVPGLSEGGADYFTTSMPPLLFATPL